MSTLLYRHLSFLPTPPSSSPSFPDITPQWKKQWATLEQRNAGIESFTRECKDDPSTLHDRVRDFIITLEDFFALSRGDVERVYSCMQSIGDVDKIREVLVALAREQEHVRVITDQQYAAFETELAKLHKKKNFKSKLFSKTGQSESARYNVKRKMFEDRYGNQIMSHSMSNQYLRANPELLPVVDNDAVGAAAVAGLDKSENNSEAVIAASHEVYKASRTGNHTPRNTAGKVRATSGVYG